MNPNSRSIVRITNDCYTEILQNYEKASCCTRRILYSGLLTREHAEQLEMHLSTMHNKFHYTEYFTSLKAISIVIASIVMTQIPVDERLDFIRYALAPFAGAYLSLYFTKVLNSTRANKLERSFLKMNRTLSDVSKFIRYNIFDDQERTIETRAERIAVIETILETSRILLTGLDVLDRNYPLTDRLTEGGLYRFFKSNLQISNETLTAKQICEHYETLQSALLYRFGMVLCRYPKTDFKDLNMNRMTMSINQLLEENNLYLNFLRRSHERLPRMLMNKDIPHTMGETTSKHSDVPHELSRSLTDDIASEELHRTVAYHDENAVDNQKFLDNISHYTNAVSNPNEKLANQDFGTTFNQIVSDKYISGVNNPNVMHVNPIFQRSIAYTINRNPDGDNNQMQIIRSENGNSNTSRTVQQNISIPYKPNIHIPSEPLMEYPSEPLIDIPSEPIVWQQSGNIAKESTAATSTVNNSGGSNVINAKKHASSESNKTQPSSNTQRGNINTELKSPNTDQSNWIQSRVSTSKEQGLIRARSQPTSMANSVQQSIPKERSMIHSTNGNQSSIYASKTREINSIKSQNTKVGSAQQSTAQVPNEQDIIQAKSQITNISHGIQPSVTIPKMSTITDPKSRISTYSKAVQPSLDNYDPVTQKRYYSASRDPSIVQKIYKQSDEEMMPPPPIAFHVSDESNKPHTTDMIPHDPMTGQPNMGIPNITLLVQPGTGILKQPVSSPTILDPTFIKPRVKTIKMTVEDALEMTNRQYPSNHLVQNYCRIQKTLANHTVQSVQSLQEIHTPYVLKKERPRNRPPYDIIRQVNITDHYQLHYNTPRIIKIGEPSIVTSSPVQQEHPMGLNSRVSEQSIIDTEDEFYDPPHNDGKSMESCTDTEYEDVIETKIQKRPTQIVNLHY